jgi:hypothetical protein
MKTIHAITLATALVPGDGSAAFAAETVVNGTPNATATTNTDAKPMNNADRGQTTCTSSSMSTTGSTSGKSRTPTPKTVDPPPASKPRQVTS